MCHGYLEIQHHSIINTITTKKQSENNVFMYTSTAN